MHTKQNTKQNTKKKDRECPNANQFLTHKALVSIVNIRWALLCRWDRVLDTFVVLHTYWSLRSLTNLVGLRAGLACTEGRTRITLTVVDKTEQLWQESVLIHQN